MDIFDWFIAVLHQMIGHDKTAIVLSQPPGDRADCILCAYERHPTPAMMDRVITAFAEGHANG